MEPTTVSKMLNGGAERELSLWMQEVYGELRAKAAKYLDREREDHTFQPTALVHEVYIELADGSRIWHNREHFLALCARVLRRVLVTYARKRNTKKRGGGNCRLEFEDGIMGSSPTSFEMLDLDDALKQIEAKNPRRAEVVEMRLFGLGLLEIAKVLGISERTAKKDWHLGRLALYETLSK